MPMKTVKTVMALGFAAVVLTLPVLIRGPVLIGHDTREHINFGQYFAEQFWQGDLYPRWLLKMNHGLGSASLFAYPPFPSYVYALLLPVARIVHLNAFSLGECLCLLASGLCAFLWMTTIVGRGAALIAALMYMLLPYHLTIDLYRRGALSECWALAWVPLVLYFTTQVVRKKSYATVGLALSYAMLVVSHLVSVVILSALPLLLVVTIAERGRKTRAFITVTGCLALGALVSGVYLVPAFANAKYFPVSRLQIPIDNGPQGNLLAYGLALLPGHAARSGFLRAISLATVSTTLLIVLCGTIVLWKGRRSDRGQTLLWLSVCPIPLFLMSGVSQPIWKAIPAFANAVQFPWRLDIVLCIAALPLTAILLRVANELPKHYRISTLAIVLLFAVAWFGAYVEVVRQLMPDRNEADTTMSIHDGWFAAWTPPGMNQDSALKASTWPAARFLVGDGTAKVMLWKPRHIEVSTDCATCGPLVVRQLYYPKWQARLAPSGEVLRIEAMLPQGLLAVQVPPGRQQVFIDMPRGLDERIGSWLSVLGIGVCGLLAVLPLVRRRV
jgi:hypothetical protein